MKNEKQNIVEGVKVIVAELQRTFGDRVKNAVLYGTAISDDFSSTSDFDVLLSFDQVNSSVILGLRQVINPQHSWGL